MNKTVLILLSLILFLSAYAQDVAQSYKFRLYLNDKGHTEFNISEPDKFLSNESIERKKRQGVDIDESDLPISNDYFNLISLTGGKVVSYSKWFKTIVIQINDSSRIDDFTKLSFVDSAKYVWRGPEKRVNIPVRPRLSFSDFSIDKETNDFGKSNEQFKLHNAEDMYKSTLSGRSMKIAVIDAGFTNADVIPYFMSNQIADYKSFVPDSEIMVDSDHGTRVFSTISGIVPGKLIGSAAGASLYLLQSEDVSSEFPVEEDYWVRAVEYADSVGVDVINSSLGYSSFNDSQLNYTHKQLDGRTAIMSLAADMAFDKGMIVVTSAGNEGSNPWQKISVPGDAEKALTVGAVDVDGVIASFSSKGLTADNRIKPDVVSVGRGTITIGQTGLVGPANGTSFSSPFMAGMVATLWSINPEINRGDLLNIIRESGDRYANPDSVYGNGVPDMKLAMSKVLKTLPFQSSIYNDGKFLIEKAEDAVYSINILDSVFDSNLHTVSIVDEDANIVLQQHMESNSLRLLIGNELVSQSNSLYMIITSPDSQNIIRFKL